MSKSLPPPLNTFVIRLWLGKPTPETRWHGRIDHLQSQKHEVFNEWRGMLSFICAMVDLPPEKIEKD
jgi:hypothetical protein